MTAELAIGVLPVASALLLAAWLAGAGAARVDAQLAAGAAARAVARGEDPVVVAQRTAAAVGDGARSEQRTEGDLVRVRVVVPLAVPLLGDVLEVTGEAVSPVEVPAV